MDLGFEPDLGRRKQCRSKNLIRGHVRNPEKIPPQPHRNKAKFAVINFEDHAASDDALEQTGILAKTLSSAAPMPLREQDAALLGRASQFWFGPQASRPGWSFGEGPIVLLVHGYSGRGVQMAVLAKAIAAQGFNAVIFDAGDHGSARREKIGFHTFIEDTAAIAEHLNSPLFAMIGHSAGGLAMMRARAVHGVEAQRYGVIAAPFFPYVPLENMLRRGAPGHVLPYIKAILSDQFRAAWSELVNGLSFSPEAALSLWQVQEKDRLIKFERKNTVGLHHLALRVESDEGLAAAFDRLSGAPGVSIEFGPELLGKGLSRHMMCLIPGGIRLELIAPAPKL